MGFSMRMKHGDIIKPGTENHIYVNGKKQGFTFDMQLAYYRGHYLSDIDTFDVYLDGEKIPSEGITLELNNKEFTVYQFEHAETEFWSQVATAKVNCLKLGGISSGEHELKLNLMLRIPYMNLGPGMYMPLDAGDTVKIVLP